MMRLRFAGLLLILLLFVSCCNTAQANRTFSMECFVGFVESTGNAHLGYVNFINEERDLTQTVQLDEGGVLLWNKHKILDEFVYFGANGLVSQKNAGIIFEVDKSTANIKKYDVWDIPITAIAVNETNLYAAGNLNGQYQIISYNKSSGESTILNVEDAYIRYMEIYDHCLYAFAENLEYDAVGYYLYIIDLDNLEVIEKVDIQLCGASQRSSCKVNDVLYFTNNLSVDGSESYNFSSYNLATTELKNYELSMPYPYQIIEYDNHLIISHYNPINSEGNYISIFDLETENIALVELDNNLSQIEVYDDKLFAANFSSAGEAGATLDVYNLFSNNKINEFLLTRTDLNNYYAGFFIVP